MSAAIGVAPPDGQAEAGDPSEGSSAGAYKQSFGRHANQILCGWSNLSAKGTISMIRGASLLSILCFLGFAVSARPQTNKAPSVLPPDGFDFSGSWDCAGAFGNKTVHKSTFTGAVILDGKWLELTEKDVEPATGYVAKYLIGYDTQAKHFVEFDANNFGAATYSSADGWQGSALTMTSPVSPDAKPYAANRFVYTVSGADTFTVDWQISKTATLEWVTSDHLVCKRQQGK